MKSGNNDFSKMPGLYIICITNYDPFGYGRLLYTIKNQCVEEPDLVYNDGVKILYFNTTGSIGGSEALSNFLKYLEESKSVNVVDDATKEIDKIVDEAVAEKEAEMQDALAEKEAALAERAARITELEAQLSKIKP